MFQKLKNKAIVIAELATIVFAVLGMLLSYRSSPCGEFGYLYDCNWEYHLSPVLAFFLSAVLILYFLNKYKPK